MRFGVSLALSLATTLGCTTVTGPPPLPKPGAGGEIIEEYPAGPYGTEIGGTIQAYELACYTAPHLDTGDLDPVTFADLYNPSGEGVFPQDSPFGAGTAKPRLLVVNVSASWCAPCKFEASELLPGEYAHFKPLGVEFLLDLADGEKVGEAANEDNLDAWVGSFDVQYPACIDPKYQLGALFDQTLFPANFIVNLETMAIEEITTGVPGDSFWLRVEELIGD